MATKTINWEKGGGCFTVTYDGSGNGTIVVTSDANPLHEGRSQSLTVKTTKGGTKTKTITVAQAMRPYIDLTNAVVTTVNQTYSGSALTPMPTVKLNGVTVPSTGYDVTYSNNTNAGTATITITGKGDYTGTATGTFTIAKANPTYTAPTAKSLTYNRGSQALLNAGSTSHGTIQYSSNGSSWSTTIPSQTNAGSYTVYWRLVGDSNHTDVSSTSINVTIAKATPVVATAPSARTGLTYTGSNQNLLSGGSMKHSSYDTTAVAGTFTYAQGKNAGTYNSLTWSFAPTDSTNYSSTSGTVSGSVSIAKASRTLSFINPTTVVAPSGNVTNTATPSVGASDGTITYSISSTTYATINSSTGKVTAKTSEGSATVTANISEGTNYLSASASYTIRVFNTVHVFAYTGNVQSLNLPAGTYKLQVWGAQGGSNAAASSYDVTARAGGKGGYSEGILTISEDKTVYIFVGGQGGSSGNGGWNGGGGGSGSSSYNSGNTNGVSRMGCGGGGTDIALVTSEMTYSSYRTNRSSESLLSRMIVAGGGGGGAMCYKGVTTTTTSWETVTTFTNSNNSGRTYSSRLSAYTYYYNHIESYLTSNETYRFVKKSGSTVKSVSLDRLTSTNQFINRIEPGIDTAFTWNPPSNMSWVQLYIGFELESDSAVVELQKRVESSSTTASTTYQNGYAGGGTTGKSYSTTWQAKQNAAGTNGAFGFGANQTATNYRYCSACGGGGWYGGGGGDKSDTDMSYVGHHGGGSGFVNTPSSAGNRPSGYTGLQLDSGTTYDGSQSFPNTAGTGNETGHAGNGYAKITRL